MATVVRKRRATSRKPSERKAHSDSEDLEDLVLHKIDNFLYSLEEKMDSLEDYGLEKLVLLDSKVKHAYDLLVSVRDEMVTEGKRTAEGFVKVLDGLYNELHEGEEGADMKALSASELVSKGVGGLEAKLLLIEEYVLEHDLSQSIQKALQSAANRLLTFEELPKPWQENPYITRGYRFCSDYKACVCSVVSVHNETCNIWTHVVGFFVMLGFAFWHWPSTVAWSTADFTDKLIMLIFLVAACKCLAFSAIWHTFSGISRLSAKKGFACADYTGITLLITASILTTEYAALYCQTTARNAYMFITFLCGIGGVRMTWQPDFDMPHSRFKRIAFFVGFAVAGALGFFHAAFYRGLSNTFWFYYPITKSIGSYLLGVVAYGLLFPEKYFTNNKILAYVGMSHNLWHICVFGGIYYHYLATVHFLQNASAFSCQA